MTCRERLHGNFLEVNMTKNKCEKFKLSEDGFCENYIGNKEHKSACRAVKVVSTFTKCG